MFLLDTSAVSELTRPSPDSRFTRWIEVQMEHNLLLSVLTVAELRRGAIRAVDPVRRQRLERWLSYDILERFQERMLPVDTEVSLLWAEMTETARVQGRPLPIIDSLIAATARAHGLTVVTRNVADFEGCGVPVISPWSART